MPKPIMPTIPRRQIQIFQQIKGNLVLWSVGSSVEFWNLWCGHRLSFGIFGIWGFVFLVLLGSVHYTRAIGATQVMVFPMSAGRVWSAPPRHSPDRPQPFGRCAGQSEGCSSSPIWSASPLQKNDRSSTRTSRSSATCASS